MNRYYKSIFSFCYIHLFLVFHGQAASISGKLVSDKSEPITAANVILIHLPDSIIYKIELTNTEGKFLFDQVAPGNYNIEFRYFGYDNQGKQNINIASDHHVDLGMISLHETGIMLQTATVSTNRTLLEVKADRIVFNVDGTINNIGNDALTLLKKAPAVQIDNNDNIQVLGRSGVLIYVDGKKLPLAGQELSNYLQSLTADQIDHFDIITNPGAKYEAQGNAGIIDIRLKRNKSEGTNISLNAFSNQGTYNTSGTSANINYKNKHFNIFSQLAINAFNGFSHIFFESYQNGLYIEETNHSKFHSVNPSGRFGLDYYLNKRNIIGFQYTQGYSKGGPIGFNQIVLAPESNKTKVDSILEANTVSKISRHQNTYNLNYRYESAKKTSLNLDMDYGKFSFKSNRDQENIFYDAEKKQTLSDAFSNFQTPSTIQILTGKADVEKDVLKGRLGLGCKWSQVISENDYLVFDKINNALLRNDHRSNYFKYDEQVQAAYINYAHDITKKIKMDAGWRTEWTNSTGDLIAYLPELQEPPVKQKYRQHFPHVGFTYEVNKNNNLTLNYGKRINRPDYNVLNPFNNQLSQLSFEKGNPFLKPEILNNVELTYTLKSQYNFIFGYSHTADQITRLIGPDDVDPRASYINWDNLATQKIYSFNASIPIELFKKVNSYFNFNCNYKDNQANYANGAVVDLQAFNYELYTQHSVILPYKIKAELTAAYSGPGIWGGVFVFEPSWGIDFGFQRKFLHDKLNVKISTNDLFYQSYWSGYSNFDGLYSYGYGKTDSRRFGINVNYIFGNQNVKSVKRKTGIEEEAGRVGN